MAKELEAFTARVNANRAWVSCGLRIGGATALFAQGVSPELIKAIGRWWSGAYLLYIRQMQGNAQRLMVEACSRECEYLDATPDDKHPDDGE